jgi:drug/metabolite transporter (DMT)-like permease
MKLRAYLLMLLVVAVWGSTFVLVKGALADATPGAFNLVRFTLAFAVLGVAYHRYWRSIQGWQVAAGAIVGLCLAVGYQFQTTGLARTTPSKSAFITGLMVVLVPLFSVIPGLRPRGAMRPHWNAFLGAVIAFIGIVLLAAPANTSTIEPASLLGYAARLLPDMTSINLGDVLTLGCAIGFAFQCIALSHFSPRIDFQPLTLLQVGFCALFMALSLPLIERPHIAWTPKLILALFVTAVLSIQSWAQAVLPPTHMALLLTLEPVFAWVTSFAVTGERLGLRPASGALLILAGIALTELMPMPRAITLSRGTE